MWLVEELVPDRWDIAGAILSLGGAGVIISYPRSGAVDSRLGRERKLQNESH